MSSICPDKIFNRAVSRSNHSARSTSGKARRLPLLGGHSISKVLLDSDALSKSACPQNAITRFPPRWRISPSACREPIEAAGPSSSANSRRAVSSGSSTYRSRLSESTRRRRPCCANRVRRDGRAALRGCGLLGDRPVCRRSSSLLRNFAWGTHTCPFVWLRS